MFLFLFLTYSVSIFFPNSNPLTNNCNTFTSAVLKCVYGFSDAKPHLGVSDLRTVTCPTETTADGKQVEQCLIPGFEVEGGDDTAVE